MEVNKTILTMLELIDDPCLCVKDGRILAGNRPAIQMHFIPGTDIFSLLQTGSEEYQTFQGGTLSVMISASGIPCHAEVRRIDGYDVFRMEPEVDDPQLRTLALAAEHLRQPLSSMLLTLEKVMSEHPETNAANGLQKNVHQLLRQINNMSDAGKKPSAFRMELQDIDSVFREICEKAGTLAEAVGIGISYQGIPETILTLVNTEELERALLNLISNAMKFTPKNGAITVKLTRQGRILYLTVQDTGTGIAANSRSSVFSHYSRQPALEDSLHGIGLGMVLARNAAAHHGGTVLIEQPEQGGTRVTMTLAIRQDNKSVLRTPMLRVDYAGDRDHTLLELSDVLPAHLYHQE